MVRAAIGIGANLGDAPGNVHEAIRLLAEIGTVAARSDLYASVPWGVTDQPAFYNAAALLDVDCGAHALLAALKALEVRLGRVPGPHWGPRAIDLDILTFGDARIDDAQLQIPHRHLFERAFALAPLAEIDPAFAPALAALAPEARAQAVRIPNSKGAHDTMPTDYDRAALTYDEERRAPQEDDPLLGALLDTLHPAAGMTIVDLGCGTGRFAVALAARGASVVGIDASPGMLARARAKDAAIRWINARLPEGIPAQFEAACAVMSLHHLSAQDRARTFERVAAAGATLAILTFEHRYFVEHPLAAAFPSFLDIELARFAPALRLESELRAAGLTAIASRLIPFASGTASFERAAQRVEKNYVSTFLVMSEDEIKRGVAQLRAWAREGKPWTFDPRAVFIEARACPSTSSG